MTSETFPPGAAPDEVILAAVPVGPAVRGPRTALAAILRYGADPELAAGPAALDRAAWGAGQVLLAVRLAWRDRALRRAAAVPVVLTALACALVAGLYTWSDLDTRHPLATLNLYMTVFVGLASMPPTLLQRQWARVANEARRALGLAPGEDPFAGQPFMRMVAVEMVKALRQAVVVAVGLLPVIVALHLLPDWIHAPAAVAGLWAFYWVVVDAFELPMEVLPGERRGGPEPWFARLLVGLGGRSPLLRVVAPAGRFGGRLAGPWREELHFTERHPWESAGMGLAAGALLSVPVLGLAFRAVVIVAATALLERGESAEAHAGAEEASSPAATAPSARTPSAPTPSGSAAPDALATEAVAPAFPPVGARPSERRALHFLLGAAVWVALLGLSKGALAALHGGGAGVALAAVLSGLHAATLGFREARPVRFGSGESLLRMLAVFGAAATGVGLVPVAIWTGRGAVRWAGRW